MYNAISTNAYCKYLNVNAQLISRKILELALVLIYNEYNTSTEPSVNTTGCGC